MRTALHVVVCFAWALWLGGLIALFTFVQHLFHADRALAVQAAPRLFEVFETYQLVVAAVLVATTLAWWAAARSRAVAAMAALFVLAAAVAVGSTLTLSPRMADLRRADEANHPDLHARFMKLHGISMVAYLAETTSLAVAGLALPTAVRRGDGSRVSTPTNPLARPVAATI